MSTKTRVFGLILATFSLSILIFFAYIFMNWKKRIFHSQFKEPDEVFSFNRPRSIYQCSNMAPGLSGQTSIFGVVFFVSKSLLGIERQKKLKKLNPKASEPC